MSEFSLGAKARTLRQLNSKNKMEIPKYGHVDAFSIIVDINGFTSMVARSDGNLIADFVRDTLAGAISAIEKCDGNVVGIMGDAVFGVLPDVDHAAGACFLIAKDVNDVCEYLARAPGWEYASPGPTIKIGIELGWLNVSEISTSAMGNMPFLIGPATNYAARILEVGEGNRCHVGPAAAAAGFDKYQLGPLQYAPGKKGEAPYQYRQLDLSDIWIEGTPEDGIYYW